MTSTSEGRVRVHEVRTRVRYVETDQMGVVYHSNYLVYFELGRTEFMRDLSLPYSEIEKEGLYFAVHEARCFFRASARYDDVIAIRTWVNELSSVKLGFAYEVRKVEDSGADDRPLADGYTTLVCLNREGKPTRIPEPLVRKIEASSALSVGER